MPVDNEEHSITNVGIEVYDKLRKNPERIDMKNTIARYLYITPLPNTENKIGTNTDLVIYRKKDESDH